MDRTLLIDAAVRTNSRTRELAVYLAAKLTGEYTHLRLDTVEFSPLDARRLEWRNECVQKRCFDDAYFDFAKQFAAADNIVIAAPFWDNSFPAMLKQYIESISIVGLTFEYTQFGLPRGLCRAGRLFYVTTAGGAIYDNAFGFGYVRALAQDMFGIPEVRMFKAENLDIAGADIQRIMEQAKAEIDAAGLK